jgi:hypothetical protein
MRLRGRYSSLCACHRIASDRDSAGSRQVNPTLLWRRSVMVEGNAVDSESFRELMIWFPRPSSRSAWNALSGERVRAGVRARACEMSLHFFSSSNSATDASIFDPLKSLIGKFCAISHCRRVHAPCSRHAIRPNLLARAIPVFQQSPSAATGLISNERIPVLETKNSSMTSVRVRSTLPLWIGLTDEPVTNCARLRSI